MLLSLSIRNIALMDEMQVEFADGLNVLTGETGAGKSIIVDAVVFLLGGKAQKELIRTGTDKARVEGLFDVSDCPAAQAFLKANELDENGDELILSREMTLQGRSTARVNGSLLPVNLYQTLTGLLMDIHGQHAHQSLMDEKKHLAFLDATGDEKHQALTAQVRADYSAWQETRHELEKMKAQAAQAQERLEILQLREAELSEARLVPGEEEGLTQERDLFRHAGKIEGSLRTAFDAVYDGGESAVNALRTAVNALRDIEGLHEDYAAMRQRLEEAYYEVEDAGLTLRDQLSGLEFDPDRMEKVENRLDLIRRLSRKHGGASTAEMVKKLEDIRREIDAFEHLDDRMDEMTEAETKLKKQYLLSAGRLTAERKMLAERFEKEMETQLCDLNMAGTKFSVSFVPVEAGLQGSETAAFLIAPNRGEELQPLSRIASGGELSRLMLAIKSVAAKREGVPSMIFDEIDTGISGRAAQVVGEKMAAIGRERQVLCVTHLQQIAALADHHYMVEKYVAGERTHTRLTELDGEGRVAEVARMLGGDDESARKHAREMLKGRL